MEGNAFSGIVLSYLGAGEVEVWITLKGPVPLGMAKYLYGNTGSNLYGKNLNMVTAASFRCMLTCPIGKTGPWNALPGKGASYFGEGYREGDSIPFYPDLIKNGIDMFVPKRYSPVPPRLRMPQAAGASSGHAVFTLQETHGDIIPTHINAPKGNFSLPGIGDRVLVMYYDKNIYPAVVGMLPYGEYYSQTIDRNINR